MVHSEIPSDFHFPTNVELTVPLVISLVCTDIACIHFIFDKEQEAGRAELNYWGEDRLLAGILATSLRIPVVFISSK